ncbi:hypothetical protein PSN45_005273 [Yamadazyma tenuis]|uniref:uncharacterized protein n=1 Tax=Candida tenuis TaxID=2315449 RepID=UPI00279DD657|nr:hypothetical protein PSN45_005273 [Yamadazyma tenuis]
MSLPSRFAPGGITDDDSRKIVTIGRYEKKPIEYTIKTIEEKVERAASHSTNKDIEMVPMDNYNEAQVISEYITHSRSLDEIPHDSMEVDGEFSNVTIEPNTSYLVIDTNFVLSHLKVLDDITKVSDLYRLRIIVPLTTIRELDGLKNSSRVVESEDNNTSLNGKTIGHLARWGNDWIFRQLSNVNSPVKGQSMKQKLDRTSIKDDSILDCCLFFKQNYPANLVVLLSNDKNLCLKALSNEVLTVSYRPTMSAKLIGETIYGESVSRYGKESGPVFVEKSPTPVPRVSVSNEEQTDFHSVAQKIYSEVFTLTKSAINHVMLAVFEEDIDLVSNYEPNKIQDLRDCDSTIRVFWISAFSEYLQRIDYKNSVFIVTLPTGKPELEKFIEEWKSY